MTDVNAYFYKNQIFVEGGDSYQTGEVLLEYLSKDFKNLDQMLEACKRYAGLLHYPETSEEAARCDETFHQALTFYSSLDGILMSLPPYNKMNLRGNWFYNLLDENQTMFDIDTEERDGEEWELGYLEHFRTDLPLEDITTPDLIDYALKFNDKLKALADEYTTFVEDLIRVKKVYEPFLERIHYRSEFLPNEETAEIFKKFQEESKAVFHTYEALQPSGTMTLSYQALKQEEQLVLCEKYHFTSIGGFLYIELFKGLQNHYLPRKCGYCGRYFLLQAVWYSDYCTRPIEGMEGKVCRDVGQRKKYADKVKNDPIWLTYSRAYKTHYARYLKKKITQKEFQVWADYALELRAKAQEGALEFEEYRELIRK